MQKDNVKIFPGNKMPAGFKIPTMLTIKETAKTTGIAEHFIRSLAIENKIIHVRCGKKYLINLEKFIEYLNNPSRQCIEPETVVNKFNLKPVEA